MTYYFASEDNNLVKHRRREQFKRMRFTRTYSIYHHLLRTCARYAPLMYFITEMEMWSNSMVAVMEMSRLKIQLYG